MTSAVPYQSFHDEDDIAVDEDELSGSASDIEEATESHPPGASCPPQHGNVEARVNQYMDNERWPRKIGIVHLLHGTLLFFLGLAQVFLIPFIKSEEENPVHLDEHNLFGLGIWSGLLLGLSGAIASRAAIYHSNRALYLFMLTVLLEIVLMTMSILMIIVGYSSGWTTAAAYKDSGALFGIHIAISTMVLFGYMLVLHAFMQYYEEVLCGQFQLCRKMVHCCCPCCCPRVVSQDELVDERTVDQTITERPPSLPV